MMAQNINRFRASAKWLGIFLTGFSCLPVLHAEVRLAGVFGDNMVLQRDSRAPVWGTANPGENVTLSLNDKKATATADKDGKWIAAFQGLKAGGPFTVTVTGTSGAPVTLNNVLVGDVWICSGQSNMEYQLKDADEIAAPEDPQFRYFLEPKNASLDPVPEIKGPASWVSASPQTRAKFSAVGYYFGKNLRKELGIPIGLINSSWGGTAAELWTPKEAIDAIPQFKDKANALISAVRSLDADAAKFAADFPAWEKKYGPLDPGNKGFAAGWAAPALDTSDWKPVNLLGDWTSLGVPNGGVIWARHDIPVSPDKAGKDLRLGLGSPVGFDTVYFNGEEIGYGGMVPPYFWNTARVYTIPGRLVKSGNNVLAVRVVTQQQKYHPFGFSNNLGIDQSLPQTPWLTKVETVFQPLSAEAAAAEPQPPTAHRDGTPTVLFNAMTLPLIPYGINGVIWYQGEQNALRGYNYRTIFPAMIEAWRARWQQGDFPFYFVQLANLGHPPKDANEPPGWAEVRESQLVTMKAVPNTGMATAVDIGEANNIHPKDKRDVGLRLSLIALANQYGKKVEYSGPVYESMTVEENKIRLKFSHVGAGLIAKDGGPLKQFSIAGQDQKFAWADATIDGDTVVISSKDVPSPVAVRYAWSGDPEGLNLYNKDGLPAFPFRTDNWPAVTAAVWWN